MAPLPLATALYQQYKKPRDEIDPVQAIRWAWDGLRRRSGLQLLYAPSMPIMHNPSLPPLMDRNMREKAIKLGLLTGGDLYPNDTFISLVQMCEPA